MNNPQPTKTRYSRLYTHTSRRHEGGSKESRVAKVSHKVLSQVYFRLPCVLLYAPRATSHFHLQSSGKRHGDTQFYAILRRPRRTYRRVGHWPYVAYCSSQVVLPARVGGRSCHVGLHSGPTRLHYTLYPIRRGKVVSL